MTIPNAEIPEKRRASDGMIWRCAACGKEAEDLYGMIGARSRGWDESCMLNAVPVPAQVDRSPEGQDREDGLDAEHESAKDGANNA